MSLPYRIDPLAAGYLVTSRNRLELTSVPRHLLAELLRADRGGLIILRGFETNRDAFKQFCDLNGSDFLVHLNQGKRDYPTGDLTLATVNRGGRAIDFHMEMASSPVAPSVLWFYCVTPAAERGRTGFADGREVLSKISREARRVLEADGFLYRMRNVPHPLWSALVPGVDDEAVIERLCRSRTGGELRGLTRDEAGSLSFDYHVPAVRRSVFSQVDVLAGGMLDSPRNTLLGSGGEVPHWIRTDVCQATYQTASWHAWAEGDVAIVDNTRFFHAREAFDGARREILLRYSDFRPI